MRRSGRRAMRDGRHLDGDLYVAALAFLSLALAIGLALGTVVWAVLR